MLASSVSIVSSPLVHEQMHFSFCTVLCEDDSFDVGVNCPFSHSVFLQEVILNLKFHKTIMMRQCRFWWLACVTLLLCDISVPV